MLLADLKSMAGGLGVAGAGSMKKAQLVEAIKAVQSGGGAKAPARAADAAASRRRRPSAPRKEPSRRRGRPTGRRDKPEPSVATTPHRR